MAGFSEVAGSQCQPESVREVLESPPVAVPEVVGAGDIGDWRYLVTTREPGQELSKWRAPGLWRRLSGESILGLMPRLGEIVAWLHQLSPKAYQRRPARQGQRTFPYSNFRSHFAFRSSRGRKPRMRAAFSSENTPFGWSEMKLKTRYGTSTPCRGTTTLHGETDQPQGELILPHFLSS